MKHSAGLIMYRLRHGNLEVLLVHPGGPNWKKRDTGAWSIPKGEFEEGEEALDAAKREFREELGIVPEGDFVPLTTVQQSEYKTVHAWAFEGDCDTASIVSNIFTMEWPPKSGVEKEFPEVDRAEWFSIDTAKSKTLKGQIPLLDELQSRFGR